MSPVETVTIGSYETKFKLTCVDRDDSGTPLTLVATLDGPGLSASLSAYDDRYEALTAFFQGLADSWRGWEGVRNFSSLEGELDITARHDGQSDSPFVSGGLMTQDNGLSKPR